MVRVHGDVLLIDAPAGAAERIGADVLGRVRAIACTGGRVQAVGGLVPLLCALERHRMPAPSAPGPLGPLDTLVLHVPLGDERGAMLAEAWQRGWTDRYPLTVDAQRPGSDFDVGPMRVSSVPVRTGDVRWATGEVERGVGMALRVTTPDLTLAVVLGAAPDRTVQRLCAGVDLAVVEVGVTDWPRTEQPWRIRLDEAPQLAAGAGELWLVGDDGAAIADGAA